VQPEEPIPPTHPPTAPVARKLAEFNESGTHCPLCARKFRESWLRKSLPAKSIHGIVVCPKCRNGFASRRQLAYILDSLLLAGINYTLIFGLLLIAPSGPTPPSGFWVGPIVAQAVLSWLILPLLFTCKDGFSGKSLGRLLCGVTVVDRQTREPIGALQSCKRNLILLAPYLGFIWVALTMMKGRRVGDFWANTEVIWDKHRHKTPFDPRGILCVSCGYDLTGNISGVCPECGVAVRRPGSALPPTAFQPAPA
jgi:uncharacterized RDD family membrane protein YckC